MVCKKEKGKRHPGREPLLPFLSRRVESILSFMAHDAEGLIVKICATSQGLAQRNKLRSWLSTQVWIWAMPVTIKTECVEDGRTEQELWRHSSCSSQLLQL